MDLFFDGANLKSILSQCPVIGDTELHNVYTSNPFVDLCYELYTSHIILLPFLHLGTHV